MQQSLTCPAFSRPGRTIHAVARHKACAGTWQKMVDEWIPIPSQKGQETETRCPAGPDTDTMQQLEALCLLYANQPDPAISLLRHCTVQQSLDPNTHDMQRVLVNSQSRSSLGSEMVVVKLTPPLSFLLKVMPGGRLLSRIPNPSSSFSISFL